MKLGAILKLEVILRNEENIHTMFIMYSLINFHGLRLELLEKWPMKYLLLI